MSEITPIGPNLARDPSDPTEIIRRAVNAAIATGITVSTVPDLGVHCTSTHSPTWEVEPRTKVVSPLGAVLVMLQPHVPDADTALAHVLGASIVWVIGFGDGCGGERPSTRVEGGPAAKLYGQGYAEGVTFRALMHRRQGVPLEWRAPETTRPLAIETPRQLIDGLLDSLTTSQVLEAAADSFIRRKASLSSDQRSDLEMAEAMLRELADDTRGWGV